MNFLDAHKIVHDYGGAVGKGTEKEAGLFRPKSYLQDLDRDIIVEAFKLFYAHMILHNTRTQEQYEQYKISFQILNTFVDDDICKRAEYHFKNKTEDMKAYLLLSAELLVNKYRNQEVNEYFDTMIDVKDELYQKYKDGEIEVNDYIYNYCIRAYENANIEFKEEYFYCFLAFSTMRSFVDDVKYEQYYGKYRDYILSKQ